MSAEMDELIDIVVKGKIKEGKDATQRCLDAGHDAKDIIFNGLSKAMSIVGDKYAAKQYFLPQVLLSANTLYMGLNLVLPMLTGEGGETKGKVVLAVVEGDVHDIGKNIVKVVLESYGYKIIDLGKDVKVEKVVEAYKKYKPKAIGLSALMTTTVASMERTIKALHEAGCSEPIWVGGAVVTEDIAHNIGADYYTEDAMAAVNLLENEILDL